MALRAVHFLAIVLTALALVPAGAHFFELPNKIDLPQDAYFTVQAIYRGWALFGIVLIGALPVDLGLAILLRRDGRRAWPALAAFALIAATLAIFFAWTYPANQATANWTTVPPDWATLRVHWEIAHAVNAALTFAALCLLVGAALAPRK